MFPPAVLAWETFQKITLITPRVASEASQVLMVRSWTSVRDAFRPTPDASPPHADGRMRRGGSGMPVSVRGRLTPAREGGLGRS